MPPIRIQHFLSVAAACRPVYHTLLQVIVLTSVTVWCLVSPRLLGQGVKLLTGPVNGAKSIFTFGSLPGLLLPLFKEVCIAITCSHNIDSRKTWACWQLLAAKGALVYSESIFGDGLAGSGFESCFSVLWHTGGFHAKLTLCDQKGKMILLTTADFPL